MTEINIIRLIFANTNSQLCVSSFILGYTEKHRGVRQVQAVTENHGEFIASL